MPRSVFFLLEAYSLVTNSENLILMQCCGSGSGRIRIIWPDPDPLYETMKRIRVAHEKSTKIMR